MIAYPELSHGCRVQEEANREHIFLLQRPRKVPVLGMREKQCDPQYIGTVPGLLDSPSFSRPCPGFLNLIEFCLYFAIIALIYVLLSFGIYLRGGVHEKPGFFINFIVILRIGNIGVWQWRGSKSNINTSIAASRTPSRI